MPMCHGARDGSPMGISDRHRKLAMRPGKRERLVLKVEKLNRRKATRNALREQLTTSGQEKPSIAHNSFIGRKGHMAEPVGTIATGGNLLRYQSNKDKPKYVIDREPKLRRVPTKTEQKQRFGRM